MSFSQTSARPLRELTVELKPEEGLGKDLGNRVRREGRAFQVEKSRRKAPCWEWVRTEIPTWLAGRGAGAPGARRGWAGVGQTMLAGQTQGWTRVGLRGETGLPWRYFKEETDMIRSFWL